MAVPPRNLRYGALLCLLATAAGASEIYWVYPPPNSLLTASPVSVLGYVVGPPATSLEATVMDADGSAPPRKEPLYLFKGKVFSGSIPLNPGRVNVTVGASVLPLLYRPGFEGDQEGEFRVPRAHGGRIDSCVPCHGFTRGELSPKGPVPDLCLGCHKVGTQSLRSVTRQNEHTRAITPECLRCHEPHAGFEKALLRAGGNPCLPCHPARSGRSRHDLAAPGCGACHDPHASAYPKRLRQEPATLCRSCHQNLISPDKYPKSHHRPVEEGKCEGCHSSHPNGNGAQTLAPVPILCRGCHPAQAEGAHQGELEECRQCHESHLSERRKLLKKGVSEACDRCHSLRQDGQSQHPGLREGCVTCHNPHRPQALVDGLKVCGTCHNLGRDRFKVAHGGLPITDVRQCSLCHEPHSSKYPALLRGTLHYPTKGGGCNACHLTAEGKIGMKYEGSENCTRCHGQITGTSTIIEMDKVHKPVYQIDCIACHNPHLGERRGLLLEDPQVLCGWCHGILLRGVEVIHGVFEKGGDCYTCHLPHISDFRPLLKRPQGELCLKCHEGVVPDAPADARKLHGVVRQGRCTGCHNPHATNTKSLLKDTPDGLCRTCHEQAVKGTKEKPWRYLHGPVGSGTCTACHTLDHSHQKEGDRFLRRPGSEVCALCHDTRPEHVPANYRGKMREVRNDCLVCHHPHGAADAMLLRATL